jgi:lipid-A-disaccharide synthase
VPEFHQEKCTAENLVSVLETLVEGGAARQRQLDGFARLDGVMAIGAEQPSERAARIAIEAYERKAGRQAPRS